MNALDEITKARSLLVLDHCFWGMLAMRLKMVESPECETAATDGEVMLFNPEYVATLSTQQLIGLEAHEVMHCAMGDIWRLDERDHLIWNMACDYVNNGLLLESKFTLPDGALVNSAYNNMAKEEVYNILYKMKGKGGKQGGQQGGQPGGKGKQGQGKGKPQQGQGQGGKHPDPGKCGTMFKPADSTKAKEAEVEWKTATAQAANVSQGTIPANLRRRITDEVLDPPLPWHVLLRDFVQRTARNDFNWSRPNRRYLSQGIILPGLLSDELPLVAIVGDTSGSTDEYQQRFANEVSGVLSCFKTTVLFLQVDARIQGEPKEYKTEDLPIEFTFHGGGGTDFRPAFDYIEKEGIEVACLIYLTDLYGTFPKNEPTYPVMWVSVTKDKKAPWGETIPMTI